MTTHPDAVVPASSFTGGWSVLMRGDLFVLVDPSRAEVAETHGLDTARYFIDDQLRVARARAAARAGDGAALRATATLAASGLPASLAHRLG